LTLCWRLSALHASAIEASAIEASAIEASAMEASAMEASAMEELTSAMGSTHIGSHQGGDEVYHESSMGSSHIVSHQGVDEVYHETQRRMWCALHALNALLQEPAYDAAALTEIALSIGGKLQLAHRWPLMGNWDINVMMIALQRRGLEVQWWDRRRSIDALQRLAEGTDCVGLICNEPGAWLFGMVPSQHWFTIRRVRGEWYDLDSKLQRPAALRAGALFGRLQRLLGREAGQVLVVVRRPAAQAEGGAGAQPELM